MPPPDFAVIRTRSISRITTRNESSWPAWRQAMTQTDTLYYNTGGVMNSPVNALVWPGDVHPTHFGTRVSRGIYNAAWDSLTGYASQVLLEDVGGPFGTVVWGTGGHTRIQNQLLGVDLNLDNPTSHWWKQPEFKTSAAGGAELYYNPTEAATFPANRIIPISEDVGGWSGEFPVAFTGWIYPDKLVTGQLGDSAPHGFRYHSPCFVPASITGTGRSAYFVTPGPQGPWAQNYKPSGESTAKWVKPEAIWPSGWRKMPYYFLDTQTKVWSEYKWQPDSQYLDFEGNCAMLFRDLKRIYLCQSRALGVNGWWYIDLANGIAKHTVSAQVQPTAAENLAPDKSAGAAHTDRNPHGRHLAYFFSQYPNHSGVLALQDFDAERSHNIVVAGLDTRAAWDRRAIMYDHMNHRLLVIVRDKTTFSIGYYSIPIPGDPVKGSYVATFYRVVPSDPSGMATSQASMSYWYGVRIHPTLGSILLPSYSARGLGFVPSPP